MRTARTELNLTEWIALALLVEGPTHGWTIVRAFRAGGPIGSVWAVSGPLVYRALSRLEAAGLVRSTGTAGGQGPERVILEATPEARDRADAWLVRPVQHVRDLRTELLAKLLLLERRGMDRTDLVHRQLDQLRPIGAVLRRRAEAAAPGGDLVDRWRAATADASVRFLEELLPEGQPPRT